jgi:hypothetical protein
MAGYAVLIQVDSAASTTHFRTARICWRYGLTVTYKLRGGAWDNGFLMHCCSALSAANVLGVDVDLRSDVRWVSPGRGRKHDHCLSGG